MDTRRAVECVVGGGLLLGPLVYALSLSAPPPAIVVWELPEPEPQAGEPEYVVIPEYVERPAPVVSEPEPVPDYAAALLLVENGHLILDGDVKPSWGRGELLELPGVAEFTAAKRADPDRVPASLWNRGSRRYDVYGRDAKLCTASVGELFVVATYDGGTLQDLFDYEVYADLEPGQEPELSPSQIRAALWETQPKWLVGQLEFEGECAGLWARDASLPAPLVFTQPREPTALAQARLAKFLESGALDELEAAYREWEQTAGLHESWEELREYTEPTVRSWVDAEGNDRVLSLDFGYPASCGSFDTEIASLEELIDGEFRVLDQPNNPIAVFDADLDGRLEYLYSVYDTDSRTRRITSETEALTQRYELRHDFTCPC